MEQQFLILIKGYKRHYPTQLVKKFPRIAVKIIDTWFEEATLKDYFDELMLMDKHDRQGFPPDVMLEIFNLSRIYDKLTDNGNIKETDVWAHVQQQIKDEIKELGYPNDQKGFFKCISVGDLRAVKLFLKAGTSVDYRLEKGNTPLMCASAYNKTAIAQELLNHKANAYAVDCQGYAPIHWAAISGSTEIISLLLAQGSSPNLRSKQSFTPLIQAAAQGHFEVVELLLDKGAGINSATIDGWTALHKAVANKHLSIAKLLLQRGASPYLQHQSGMSVIDLARKNDLTELDLNLGKASRIQKRKKRGIARWFLKRT